MKVYGIELFNWKGLKDVPPEHRKAKILEAIVHAMKRIGQMPVENVKMTGADSNLTSGVAPIAHRLSDTIGTPDRGYEVLFDEVDMRLSTSKSFDLLNVSGGVTFYQQEPGEEAKLSKLPSATKVAVAMLRFTGGFPILDDWLRFNEYYKIDQLTSDTVKRWYDTKATLFYGLLTALSAGINESFATDDVTTINNACAAILTNLEALGYPVSETNRFFITCHPNLKMRIFKALAAAFMNPNANNSEIVWPIAGVISTTKIASTSYYVSLPGEKNKRGEWDDLNAREPQRNELKLGADHVWTGAYNGVIGEVKQHRRCALA